MMTETENKFDGFTDEEQKVDGVLLKRMEHDMCNGFDEYESVVNRDINRYAQNLLKKGWKLDNATDAESERSRWEPVIYREKKLTENEVASDILNRILYIAKTQRGDMLWVDIISEVAYLMNKYNVEVDE